MNKLIIYTDGCCYPNPGQGTWAFVCPEPYFSLTGFNPNTTNNEMEIKAVLEACKYAKETGNLDNVEIISDSQYVVRGLNEWISNWRRRGWNRKDAFGDLVPIKNKELWIELNQFKGRVELNWVRGHNGNEWNEMADQLCTEKYFREYGVELGNPMKK